MKLVGMSLKSLLSYLRRIEALEVMLTRIEGDAKSSVNILSEVQQLQAEIVKLRDLCVKHESEAADANQVGRELVNKGTANGGCLISSAHDYGMISIGARL